MRHIMTIRRTRRKSTGKLRPTGPSSTPDHSPWRCMPNRSNIRPEPSRNVANLTAARTVFDHAASAAIPLSRSRAIAKSSAVKENSGARFKRP
jgi:hypothetical protein